MQNFGALLKSLRTNAGYTQHDFAQLLRTSDSTISKWERGKSIPDAVYLRNISHILNISCDELLHPTETLAKMNAQPDTCCSDVSIYSNSDTTDDIVTMHTQPGYLSVLKQHFFRFRRALLICVLILFFAFCFITLTYKRYNLSNTSIISSEHSELYILAETRNNVETIHGSAFEIVFYLNSSLEIERDELITYADSVAKDWRSGMYENSSENTLVVSFYYPSEDITDWEGAHFRASYLNTNQ